MDFFKNKSSFGQKKESSQSKSEEPEGSPTAPQEQLSKTRGSRLGKILTKINKKRAIIFLLVVVFLVGVVSAYYRYGIKSKEEGKIAPIFPVQRAKKASPKLVANPLDNRLVEPEKANRHPLAVVVENHPDARPQSGLDKASVVYEAYTEGNITRFMAIFGPEDASEVGPVRSARSFFVDWAQEYDAYFAHAGGALDALRKISAEGVLDLPHTKGFFTRKNYNNAASEHTLYTTTKNLYALAKKRGYSQKASFQKLEFKPELDINKRGNLATIKIGYGGSYDVVFTYDKQKNQYARSLAGSPHKMRQSSKQIIIKNLIVQEVARAPIHLPSAKPTFKFTTRGSGKATVFVNGHRIEGTWKKEGRNRTRFYDDSGEEISFVPGKFWISIIPPGVSVTTTEVKTAPSSSENTN